MAVKTVDIDLSEFEQGGFYINSGGNYSSNTEVRTSSSNKIAIPDMFSSGNIITLTIISEGNMWSFGGYNSSNSYVDMRPEASGYKESGTVINISSYTQTRTLRIELHNDNGISPPQEAILRVVYEDGALWEMEGDYPIPIKSLPIPDSSFTKPYPASLWRIDGSNDGLPYNDLMPDVVYVFPEMHLPNPPEINTGQTTVIDDESSIEYVRYQVGYTNPNLYRFRDGELPEGVRCEVSIRGTNSYRYTEITDYEDGSTTCEIP